jgi:hypothetical protein
MAVDVAATNPHDIVWATCTQRMLLTSFRAGEIFRYDGVIVVRYGGVSSGEAASRWSSDPFRPQMRLKGLQRRHKSRKQ